MIAKRRWPRPKAPSMWTPRPSGPRCAKLSVMRSTAAREAGARSKFKMPITPHMLIRHPGIGYLRRTLRHRSPPISFSGSAFPHAPCVNAEVSLRHLSRNTCFRVRATGFQEMPVAQWLARRSSSPCNQVVDDAMQCKPPTFNQVRPQARSRADRRRSGLWS